MTNAAPRTQKDWVNIAFLSATPIIGVFGTAAYAIRFGVRWWEPALFLATYVLVGLSVTAGYHRLYAHSQYGTTSWGPRDAWIPGTWNLLY